MMRFLCTFGVVLLAGAMCAARADFDLGWFSVDSGGDIWTTGGSYELSGTIGQPDANGVVLTGGGFSLIGGFWAGAPAGPTICVGDLNCDGTYGQGSFGDINPFVLYLSNFSAWQATYSDCPPEVGDINGDGTYPSFGDINPFVTLMTSGQGPCP